MKTNDRWNYHYALSNVQENNPLEKFLGVRLFGGIKVPLAVYWDGVGDV